MGKAKTAAVIIGGVSTCIAGVLLTSYITAPTVGTVASRKSAEVGAIVLSGNDASAITSGETTKITDSKREKKSNAPVRILDFGGKTYVQSFEEKVNLANDYYEQDVMTTESYGNYSEYNYEIPNETQAFTESYTEPHNYVIYDSEAVTESGYYGEAFSYINTDYTYVQPETEYVTEYIAPVTQYIAPETVYVAPETQYIAPETEYYAPVTEYVAPVTEYVPETIVPPTTAAPVVQETFIQNSGMTVSESDFILLCNVVAHEAGCNWISTYDKAKVVEVVMNRVNSPLYPGSIYGVLTAPYQFTGSSSYADLGYYSAEVTQDVINAVNLYLSDPSQFQHGYYSFYGDGYQNYFS